MIKCFCDRCGKEIPKEEIAVSTKYLTHKLNEYEVCLDCIQAFGIWMGTPETDPIALKPIWKPGDREDENVLCCPHCKKPLETNGIGDKKERRFCPRCGLPFTLLTWEESEDL